MEYFGVLPRKIQESKQSLASLPLSKGRSAKMKAKKLSKMNPPKSKGEGDDVSEDMDRQMQELQYVTSHLTELKDKKERLQEEAKRAQEALKRVEWEHRMGEATTSWYQLRFEERKAAKAVKKEEEKLKHQQIVVEKARNQWKDLQNAVQKATQIAQELHNEGPTIDENVISNGA